LENKFIVIACGAGVELEADHFVLAIKCKLYYDVNRVTFKA
jgi:hypothetical protein